MTSVREAAEELFFAVLPVAIGWGLAIGIVALPWVDVTSRTFARLRDRHPNYWALSGKPWHMYQGPSAQPERKPRLGEKPVRSYPSLAWAWGFSLRRLPAQLAGDDVVVALHGRARLLGWVLAVAVAPLFPYVALAAWVLFLRV